MPKLDLEERMSAVDNLITTSYVNGRTQSGIIKEIRLSEIQDFENHPFQVRIDAKMIELANSINENGVLEPALVRILPDGGYQMISGHRRKKACELLNKETIPCIVKEMTKEEAIITMVDSNFQREKILPSEKGFAYKMKMDAENHQGKRNDLTLYPMATKLDNAEKIGKEFNESRTTVFRHIRLTKLIPELLQMVDNKANKISPGIALRPGAELSFLLKEEQEWVLDSIKSNLSTPSLEQAQKFRKMSKEHKLTKNYIEEELGTIKGNQVELLKIEMPSLRTKIPRSVPQAKYIEYIEHALDFYNRYLEKQKATRQR